MSPNLVRLSCTIAASPSTGPQQLRSPCFRQLVKRPHGSGSSIFMRLWTSSASTSRPGIWSGGDLPWLQYCFPAGAQTCREIYASGRMSICQAASYFIIIFCLHWEPQWILYRTRLFERSWEKYLSSSALVPLLVPKKKTTYIYFCKWLFLCDPDRIK